MARLAMIVQPMPPSYDAIQIQSRHARTTKRRRDMYRLCRSTHNHTHISIAMDLVATDSESEDERPARAAARRPGPRWMTRPQYRLGSDGWNSGVRVRRPDRVEWESDSEPEVVQIPSSVVEARNTPAQAAAPVAPWFSVAPGTGAAAEHPAPKRGRAAGKGLQRNGGPSRVVHWDLVGVPENPITLSDSEDLEPFTQAPFDPDPPLISQEDIDTQWPDDVPMDESGQDMFPDYANSSDETTWEDPEPPTPFEGGQKRRVPHPAAIEDDYLSDDLLAARPASTRATAHGPKGRNAAAAGDPMSDGSEPSGDWTIMPDTDVLTRLRALFKGQGPSYAHQAILRYYNDGTIQSTFKHNLDQLELELLDVLQTRFMQTLGMATLAGPSDTMSELLYVTMYSMTPEVDQARAHYPVLATHELCVCFLPYLLRIDSHADNDRQLMEGLRAEMAAYGASARVMQLVDRIGVYTGYH